SAHTVTAPLMGRERRRQTLRCKSLAALSPTRKIQARRLRTSGSESQARQHLIKASWAASWASSWLPSRKNKVLTSSARTSLKARTSSSPELVAPFKFGACSEVLTGSSLMANTPQDESSGETDWGRGNFLPESGPPARTACAIVPGPTRVFYESRGWMGPS